ncbi:MAG: Crp/Fnr family transcriptional regulator [Elusimicrobiota bacterium]
MTTRPTFHVKHTCPLHPLSKCDSCNCWDKCVLNFLDAAWKKRFKRERQIRHYKRRQHIFREGDRSDGLFIVCKGHVRTLKDAGKGRTLTLRYLGCGDLIGAASFISGAAHCHSADTLQESMICYINGDFSREVLDAYPEFGKRLLLHLSEVVTLTIQHTTGWAVKTATGRLAEFLLALNRPTLRGTETDCRYMKIPYTRKSIAECIGVASETVIRSLAAFQKRGWIKFTGKQIEILDRPALEEMVEKE